MYLFNNFLSFFTFSDEAMAKTPIDSAVFNAKRPFRMLCMRNGPETCYWNNQPRTKGALELRETCTMTSGRSGICLISTQQAAQTKPAITHSCYTEKAIMY